MSDFNHEESPYDPTIREVRDQIERLDQDLNPKHHAEAFEPAQHSQEIDPLQHTNGVTSKDLADKINPRRDAEGVNPKQQTTIDTVAGRNRNGKGFIEQTRRMTISEKNRSASIAQKEALHQL